MVNKFNNMDIKKVLQLIESFYFRNLITKSNPNKFEMFFAELAYGISKGTISNIDLVLKNIDENIIEDELFIQYFKNYVPKNRDISKHILREINDFYESEIQAICDNSSLNLEHIMPQNPRKKDWAMCSDEENYKLHINMIGNLTLLGEEYNKSISNKPFDEKKATYLNSKINITNKIAKWDDWTFETIHERQEELCKDALKRWPKLSF